MSALDLVATLAHRNSPALTHYDVTGRIELTGSVVARWANKITAMMLSEADATPRSRVVVALPAHWRQIVWTLGILQAGCRADLISPRDLIELADPNLEARWKGADIAIGENPALLTQAVDSGVPAVYAQTLSSLATQWEGEVPEGAEDALPLIASEPDALSVTPPVHPQGDEVLSGTGFDSEALFQPVESVHEGERVILTASSPLRAAIAAMGVWAGGAELILVTDTAADLARIAQQENARELRY